MSMILETRRMILRNFIRADIDRYPEIRDPVSHPQEPAGELGTERSRELARGYVAAANCQPRVDYQLAMLERRNGRLVGRCGICLHGPRARTAVLECEVATDWRRQGLALEAVQALLTVAFRDLELEYVNARIPIGNSAGEGLATQLGMRPVDAASGSEHSGTVYGIAAKDWTRAQS